MTLEKYVEWDAYNWGRAIPYWEEHTEKNLSTVTALELGGRHGRLSMWLADKGAHVICSDIEGPTETARDLHKGYNNAITHKKIDALDIPYENHFDVVFFKSILGGIGANGRRDKQAKALQQIHNCLKPGGELFFAENLEASPLHRYVRKKFIRWAQYWEYVSVDQMKSHLSPFSTVNLETAGFSATFGRREWQRQIMGRLDQYILEPLMPDTWHYIVYGIARKN